jgi:hypothetical protein
VTKWRREAGQPFGSERKLRQRRRYQGCDCTVGSNMAEAAAAAAEVRAAAAAAAELGVERGSALPRGPLEYFKQVSSSENHCRSQAEVLSPSFDGSSR